MCTQRVPIRCRYVVNAVPRGVVAALRRLARWPVRKVDCGGCRGADGLPGRDCVHSRIRLTAVGLRRRGLVWNFSHRGMTAARISDEAQPAASAPPHASPLNEGKPGVF
jgi:hypothetical protein